MNKTLEDLRKEIDSIDDALIDLLAKRIDKVREIGKVKKEKALDVLDEKRWNEVLEKITNKTNELNLPENLVKKIYDEIHKAALQIENE